ncbi:hypothetical protein HK405_004672 [Cladochytrium tenue]|nr:hypothetical protein HK405_004672 [Cladochytrium tenue]
MISTPTGSIQFQQTTRAATSANEPNTSSQVSINLASLVPIIWTNLEQLGLISTPVDPPPAGSGGSASAAIVVRIDGGRPRNQQALGASVSASPGQPTIMEAATAASSIDGDENAAPQHAPYVCECTLLQTTKEGKPAFGCTHPLCEKIVIGENNAKNHRHTHDLPRVRVPCDGGCGSTSCNKSFTRKRDLDRHKEEASDDAKKFACICGSAFTRRGDLKRHYAPAGEGHGAANNSGWAARAPVVGPVDRSTKRFRYKPLPKVG